MFFALDPGAYDLYPQLSACYAQNRIPFSASRLSRDSCRQSSIRISSPKVCSGRFIGTWCSGWPARFLQSRERLPRGGCYLSGLLRPVPGEILARMHQTGLSSGQIVTYDVGCPTSFASPSSIEQAVLQFKT